MRKNHLLLVAGAFALVGACSKTENGDIAIKRPDVDVKTTTDTLHLPTVGSKIDTITTPVIGTQKETLIVNKPVVGTKQTEVRVPTLKKKP